MCRALKVSASGYYAWLNRKPSPRQIANASLQAKIEVIFYRQKQRAGSIRITKQQQIAIIAFQ